MFNRKTKYILLSLLILLAGIFYFISFAKQSGEVKIIFLNVGQGDSILITDGSNQILIDGGRDGKLLLQELGKYIPFWDRNIEMLVTTHPDQDHIGGFIEVLRAYKVSQVVKTNAESDSLTYKKLMEEIKNNGSKIIEAKKNLKIKFGSGIDCQVLYPAVSLASAVDNNSNDNSIVMRLDFGKNSFLFTGDLPTTAENKILNENISAKVLKVSHHGSKYATSNEFLDAVRPADAIISVGKNNSYGHPNAEVLQKLLTHKVNIIRTDEVGDVIYDCLNSDAACLVSYN